MTDEIPRLDAATLDRPDSRAALCRAATETGFMTVHNTGLTGADMTAVLDAYRGFFHLPADEKARVDMTRTKANRGWGAPRSERVDPAANPDFKEVFDCGFELAGGDPLAGLPVYAPNLWPDSPPGFRQTVQDYYRRALSVSLRLLAAIAEAIGEPRGYFADKFDRPMALLRGNFYPARPDWAGEKDFGIGEHTDYGCLTLLATDGGPGLEVRGRNGRWLPLSAPPGEFIINFGEMLEMWTNGRVVATPHRVKGSDAERISIPLFFNPSHDTNVAPIGSGRTILAGEHLQRRFDETYLHLHKA